MPPDELDLDGEGSKTSPKKLILLIVVAILLVGGSVAATLIFTGALDEDKDKDKKEELADINQTFYLPLTPEFIVNFSGEQSVSYMQIEMAIMARQQHYLDMATTNMPMIRHEILLLLSNQKYDELRTKAGKEKLRQVVLAKLQEIVISQNPKAPSIEAVYFTNFIMQ